jgi:hypothetical protein
MSPGIDGNLVLALGIVIAAVGLFAWAAASKLKRAGKLFSQGGPATRLYMLLGLAAGAGLLYVTRR